MSQRLRSFMHRTTVRLDEHLLAQAKEYAARHRKSLTTVIEDALRFMLTPRRNGEKTPVKKGRLRLPVSNQKSGPLPGVPSLDCYGELVEWMEKDLPLDQRR